MKKIICLFMFLSGCIFSNSSNLKLPVHLKMNIKYLLGVEFKNPGMLVNRLKIVKMNNNYQIYSLQIISYGDMVQEDYSFYFAKGSKIRIFYTSADGEKSGEIKDYRLEKKVGKNIIYISKNKVSSSPIFFIERIINRKAEDHFFYSFLPALSEVTQFSDLDIDLGRKLAVIVPKEIEDSIKIVKEKTRYKIIYAKDDEKIKDFSKFVFVSEKNPQSLIKILSRDYYAKSLSIKNKTKTKFSLLYKGHRGISRLMFMHEYLLKNSLTLKKNIIPKSISVDEIYTVGDYARSLAAISKNLGYKSYSFLIPVSEVKGFVIPFSMIGLKIVIAGKNYYFFPTSRYAKGGLIPFEIQGKKVIEISKNGDYSIVKLPLVDKGSRIFAYNTFNLTGEGMKYRTSLTFTGLPAENVRNIINGWPRAVGHQKAASYLFGKNNLINSRYFRSIGRTIPHLTLKIKAGGLLTIPIVWKADGSEGLLKISLFNRLEETQQQGISRNEKLRLFRKLRSKCKESTIFKIPLGWDIKGLPLKKRINNKFVDYSLSCVLRRGKIIKKPRKWSSSDWQNWLKDNPGRKQDEIFAKRSFRLKAFKISVDNLSKLATLMKVILRDKIRVVKK